MQCDNIDPGPGTSATVQTSGPEAAALSQIFCGKVSVVMKAKRERGAGGVRSALPGRSLSCLDSGFLRCRSSDEQVPPWPATSSNQQNERKLLSGQEPPLCRSGLDRSCKTALRKADRGIRNRTVLVYGLG